MLAQKHDFYGSEVLHGFNRLSWIGLGIESSCVIMDLWKKSVLSFLEVNLEESVVLCVYGGVLFLGSNVFDSHRLNLSFKSV